MKIYAQMNETTSSELKQKVAKIFEETEDKNEAVMQAVNAITDAKYAELAESIREDAEKSASDADYRKTLGLRHLSADENKFYDTIKRGANQAVTADQIGTLPLTIINKTMADIKAQSNVLDLVNMTPAGVKLWVTGSHSGAAVWGTLTDGITAELTAAVKTIQIDANKLSAYIAIPKAIRDLANEFVDQYFTAVLSDAMEDGLEAGYINGDGKVAPIGLMRKIDAVETDSTHTAKAAVTLKAFSPKALAPIRKTLSNNGKRAVSSLAIICNPLDEAEYVDPALFGEKPEGGYKDVSFMPITKYATVNCPEGSAIITMPGVYTLGLMGVVVDEYKETKALDDVDLLIGKAYGNGRADDDNAAVVIDVTKLEEYIPTFISKTAA